MGKKMLNVVYLNGAEGMIKRSAGEDNSDDSIWTGHVDVEGLKAIGWDNEDIAYFQKHGVNWDEEDDEYYKVSDDNKALYGVLTADNIQEYKDRIIYLPKIDLSNKKNYNLLFDDCRSLIAIPRLNWEKGGGDQAQQLFNNCTSLVTVYPIENINIDNGGNGMFMNCYTLKSLPIKDFEARKGFLNSMFNRCRSIRSFSGINLGYEMYNLYSTFAQCQMFSLPEMEVSNNTSFTNTFSECFNLTELRLVGLRDNLNVSSCRLLSKESVLFIINNESAINTITITLYERVYTRLATDTDIVAALVEHPLVSLASA